MGNNPFTVCKSLYNLTIHKNNKHFILDDGCVYNPAKTILYSYLYTKFDERYDLPDTVVEIKNYVFHTNFKMRIML